VTFLADSKLTRIEASAFFSCSSLTSFVVPSSVVFIGERSFSDCDRLSDLQFASPSHVRKLFSLPLFPGGLTDVPDSVETLAFLDPYQVFSKHALAFGPESRLKAIDFHPYIYVYRERSHGLFLRLSSGTLKTFRSNIEFPEEAYMKRA
jgi:hypothetical protein